MRVPRTSHRTDGTLDSALTPMIDVVFQLLIFFLWTSHFAIDERNLASRISPPVEGQGAAGSDRLLESEDFERVVLRLTVDRSRVAWTLNGRRLTSSQELKRQLLALIQVRTDLPLLIDPDDQVPMGELIDAYDRAHEVGWTNVQFTTRRPD